MSELKKRRRSTQQIQELLRIYAEQGRRLEDMPVLLGREVSTLKRHARAAGATFEDYRPRGVNG
jgi:hypothetical protein